MRDKLKVTRKTAIIAVVVIIALAILALAIWPALTDWAQEKKTDRDYGLIMGLVNGVDAFIHTDADLFTSATIKGLAKGGIYALLALGLVLLYKATGIVNLAHGGILVLGAYVAASLVPNWPDGLAVMATLALGAFLGWILYRFAMRPLIGQPLMVTVILTLVLYVLIDNLTTVWWGGNAKVLTLLPKTTVEILDVNIQWSYIWAVGIALFLFLLVVIMFRYSRIGLAMRCVSDSHMVSQSMGINVKWIFSFAWMLAGALAVASGFLLGSVWTVNPVLGSLGLIKALPVILLGGMESVAGVLVGGLILGLVEMYCGQYIEPELRYNFRDIAGVMMMFGILLIRPTGLFGRKQVVRI